MQVSVFLNSDQLYLTGHAPADIRKAKRKAFILVQSNQTRVKPVGQSEHESKECNLCGPAL